MLSEDYIVRMINLAIAAILRIIGLKKGGDFNEALQLIDITFEQLIGLRSSTIKALEDERLYYLLTRGDRLDTQRLALIASLFEQEGDILEAQNRPEEAREDHTRALRYCLEVFFNENGRDLEGLIDQIERLASSLELQALNSNTLWPLAGYFEETGALSRAESALETLASRPDLLEQLRPELVAFYERMQSKPAAELEKGNLDQARVTGGLARYRKD